MTQMMRRLILDDEGQDLVEYALLTGFVALATLAGVNALGTAINQAYAIWDANQQAIYQPPPPAAP
jgi:Flp pilus assembly pilin Flp